MAKISISGILKSRRRFHITTTVCLLILSLIFGQMIFWQTKKPAKAQAFGPIVMSGFIYNNGNGNIYCPDVNTQMGSVIIGSSVTYNCMDVNKMIIASNADLVIDGTSAPNGSIMIVLWGPLTVSSLHLKNATLTHAPLVYHTDGATTHSHNVVAPDSNGGYIYYSDTGEQDLSDLTTGALSSTGLIKKVDITANQIFFDSGGKIDVTGKGYPGGLGRNENNGVPYDTEFFDTEVSGSPWKGLPLNYGGNPTESFRSTGYPSLINEGGGAGGGGYINSGTSGRSGGQGCNDNCSTISLGGFAYQNGSGDASINYGAGGGSAGNLTYNAQVGNSIGRGANGGGYVHLTASAIYFSDYSGASTILANGGISESNGAGNGGGGGGGVIRMQVDKFYTLTASTADGVLTGGSKSESPAALWGTDSGAVTNINHSNNDQAHIGNYLSAIGGSGTGSSNYGGGGGGGGFIKITGQDTSTLATQLVNCRYLTAALLVATGFQHTLWNVTSDSDGAAKGIVIPATCEAQDVVLDGTGGGTADTHFYADQIMIWQPGATRGTVGTGCIGVAYSDCDSKRRFSSLTLQNGAILTHQGVTVADMGEDTASYGGTPNNSLADNTIGIGRDKKVDIVTTGNITLNDTSKINVDGKGYPGELPTSVSKDCNNTNSCGMGYGPGGGGGSYIYNNSPAGAGGGYGGAGASGVSNSGGGIAGVTYQTPSVPNDFGSGGGSSITNPANGTYKSGGSGGGRIFLTSAGFYANGTDVRISANGSGGACQSSACSGSGSGGSITITVANPITNVKFTENPGTNAGEGSLYFQNATITYGTTANITANGGSNQLGGGGGRIAVITPLAPVVPTVTISKSLAAVSRGTCTGSTCFNPYALQKGDVIKVTLNIAGVPTGSTATVTDNYLTNGTVSCNYVSGSASPAPATTTPNIGWNVGPTDTQLTYNCTVQ